MLENNPLWQDAVALRLTRRSWALPSKPWRTEDSPSPKSWTGIMVCVCLGEGCSGTTEELVTENPCVIGPQVHAMSEPFVQLGNFFEYETLKDSAGVSCNSSRPTLAEKSTLRKVFLDDCLLFWLPLQQLLGSMSQMPNFFKEQLSGHTLGILFHFEVLWVRTLAYDYAIQPMTPEAFLSFS